MQQCRSHTASMFYPFQFGQDLFSRVQVQIKDSLIYFNSAMHHLSSVSPCTSLYRCVSDMMCPLAVFLPDPHYSRMVSILDEFLKTVDVQ